MRNALMVVVLSLAFAGVVGAQNNLHVAAGDLSIPFGSVPGKVITVGDYLIFVDQEHPESSFALSRTEVRELTIDNRVAAIQTAKPIRDRSGDRTQFNIRLEGDSEARALTNWFGTSGARRTEPEATTSDAASTVRKGDAIYEARHDHRLRGNCKGRLIVTDKGLSYESIDNLSDSRQWGYTDIKELTLSNPYEIRIVPFDGNDYKLNLQGTGMDTATFKNLVDRVTAARATRESARTK